MSNQEHDNHPGSFTYETIPEAGYVLEATEQVSVSLDITGREPSGHVMYQPRDPAANLSADLKGLPYYELGVLRVGGEETYVDLNLAVMQGTNGTMIAGMLVPDKDGYKTWQPIPDKLVVGRESDKPSLRGLPDTVSWQHVAVKANAGEQIFQITNLEPTNSTILLPGTKTGTGVAFTVDTPRPKQPDSPIFEATMAVDPVSGKSVYAGSRVHSPAADHLEAASQEAVLQENRSGLVLPEEVAGSAAALKAAANRVRQRRAQAANKGYVRHA